MNNWVGKIALVTGASAGIGTSVVEKLVKNGMKVAACARNFERLEEIASKLNAQGPGEMFSIRCDLSVEKEIMEMFQKIEAKYGMLHVCVNNAGLAHSAPLLSGSYADWKSMLSVNVLALCLCTKESVKLMQKNHIDDGHIININSMSGHRVVDDPSSHFYSCTKFAVTSLTEGLRQELRAQNSHIRSTSISPGMVDTEFQLRMHKDQAMVQELKNKYEFLSAEDIADTVIYALNAPARMNVCDVLIRPTEQKA